MVDSWKNCYSYQQFFILGGKCCKGCKLAHTEKEHLETEELKPYFNNVLKYYQQSNQAIPCGVSKKSFVSVHVIHIHPLCTTHTHTHTHTHTESPALVIHDLVCCCDCCCCTSQGTLHTHTVHTQIHTSTHVPHLFTLGFLCSHKPLQEVFPVVSAQSVSQDIWSSLIG